GSIYIFRNENFSSEILTNKKGFLIFYGSVDEVFDLIEYTDLINEYVFIYANEISLSELESLKEKLKGRLILYAKNPSDLLLNMLSKDSVGKIITPIFNPYSWVEYKDWMFYSFAFTSQRRLDWFYSSFGIWGEGALSNEIIATKNHADYNFTFTINSDCFFSTYLKLFTENGALIKFSIDNSEEQIVSISETENFSFVKLMDIYLKKGPHNMSISVIQGSIVIDILYLLPSDFLEGIMKNFDQKNFWNWIGVWGDGNISEPTLISYNNSTLKISFFNGTGETPFIAHKFMQPNDWSKINFIQFYFYHEVLENRCRNINIILYDANDKMYKYNVILNRMNKSKIVISLGKASNHIDLSRVSKFIINFAGISNNDSCFISNLTILMEDTNIFKKMNITIFTNNKELLKYDIKENNSEWIIYTYSKNSYSPLWVLDFGGTKYQPFRSWLIQSAYLVRKKTNISNWEIYYNIEGRINLEKIHIFTLTSIWTSLVFLVILIISRNNIHKRFF
ncbi:MAG: hypothetical protein ACFFDN_42515, partial [Candidatus Hodarchaeota archaeon]